MGHAGYGQIERGMWRGRGFASSFECSILERNVMWRTCKSTFVDSRTGAGVEALSKVRGSRKAVVVAALRDLATGCCMTTMVDSTSQVLSRNPGERTVHEERRGS